MARKPVNSGGDQDTPAPAESNEMQPVVVSVDDVAGPVLELPEVTEGAAVTPEVPMEGATDGEQPAAGNTPEPQQAEYDPAIHLAGPDGKPRKNKDGSYRLKPGARKQAEKAAACDPAVCRTSAETCVALMVTAGRMYGGEEWEPLPDERNNLVDSFDRYFQATGSPDLPPGLALAVAVTAYAAPRFFLPKTKTRTLTIWRWFKVNILGSDEEPGPDNETELRQ